MLGTGATPPRKVTQKWTSNEKFAVAECAGDPALNWCVVYSVDVCVRPRLLIPDPWFVLGVVNGHKFRIQTRCPTVYLERPDNSVSLLVKLDW